MVKEADLTGVFGFTPSLNEDHRYAVGLRIMGGCVPLQSYPTKEELEKGFLELYQFAEKGSLSRPIALERIDITKRWDGGRCLTLPDLMHKVLIENGLIDQN